MFFRLFFVVDVLTFFQLTFDSDGTLRKKHK